MNVKPSKPQRTPAWIARGSWLTVVFIGAVMLLIWSSFSLSPASAWIPRAVLVLTLVLLFLQLISDLGGSHQHPEQDESLAGSTVCSRSLKAVCWLGLLLLLTWIAGLALGSALFCLAWLRLHAGDSWPASLVMSCSLGGVLWLFFPLLLGVQLYTGLLWP